MKNQCHQFGTLCELSEARERSTLAIVLEILLPKNLFHEQLHDVVHSLTRDHRTSCLDSDVETLASDLNEQGFQVHLLACQEYGVPSERALSRSSSSHLRHQYLVCSGYILGGTQCLALTEPLIIDPSFKAQFQVRAIREDSSYNALLEALPNFFIGTSPSLHTLVSIMAAGLAGAFRRCKLPLPPWRTEEALLTKWAPVQLEEVCRCLATERRTVRKQSPDTSLSPFTQCYESTAEIDGELPIPRSFKEFFSADISVNKQGVVGAEHMSGEVVCNKLSGSICTGTASMISETAALKDERDSTHYDLCSKRDEVNSEPMFKNVSDAAIEPPRHWKGHPRLKSALSDELARSFGRSSVMSSLLKS
ncbi:hypothetical protein CEUSTIGMA_g3377.t1 [Chlamydomonas eustigma]|uniref:Uncharacterized protein n=1 Tax=Chlamydomonas eustigma TaxID=1157962 RepID=A0A250WYL3_9CHLO|nr:hypothetical protein CEUSTIGMA_g3377.t1 [Chlamydomonas eustigma]|eukprot:GAX75934.1 hypothetical protein CEUSTIGMA_g3377.t1 [Chlamydomonas eustigma]